MENTKRIIELTKRLNQYRDSYYNKSVSEVSDYEYDRLFDELKQLEEETNIVMADSPTHTVGYEVKSKLEKVKHSHPMLSLDKTKSSSKLKEFINNKEGLLMCKMDGLTILLVYEGGKLVLAETRGNGEIGEVVTHNARVFENIPLSIPYLEHFEVEGEAIITYDDFEKINEKLPEKERYKNPRNLVSGSARQLDSSVAAQRHIKFIAWKVPSKDGTMEENLKSVKKIGFDIVPFLRVDNSSNIEKSIEILKECAKRKQYPIDGLVMAYNDIQYGKSLGMTGHHPRHSIAFKFYDEEEITVLKDIEWSMGKTGELTPVAIFEAVEIDGTTVERASLHNISIVKSLCLGIGDEIAVYKANQIIPQIRESITKGNSFDIPQSCPVCGYPTMVVKDKKSEILVCRNPACKGRLLGKLVHFVSKNAADIDGLSEQTLQKLIELGYLNSFRDIYELGQYKEKLYALPGFGKKSVDALLESIEKSRNISLNRFIYSLSIPLIGRTASKSLSKYFHGNYTDFVQALENKFDWQRLEDFGETMSASIREFTKTNLEDIKELAKEFQFEEVNNDTSDKTLKGKNFVITGNLTQYCNREELVKVIENLGGKVLGSVSGKTSYLINNDVNSMSSKNKKARELNIPIISEADFVNMIS